MTCFVPCGLKHPVSAIVVPKASSRLRETRDGWKPLLVTSENNKMETELKSLLKGVPLCIRHFGCLPRRE